MKTKTEKPTFDEICEFGKVNAQQLCNMIPESNIATRKVKSIEAETAIKKAERSGFEALRQRLIKEVEFFEIQVRRKIAIDVLYSSEMQANQIRKDTIDKLLIDDKKAAYEQFGIPFNKPNEPKGVQSNLKAVKEEKPEKLDEITHD